MTQLSCMKIEDFLPLHHVVQGIHKHLCPSMSCVYLQLSPIRTQEADKIVAICMSIGGVLLQHHTAPV